MARPSFKLEPARLAGPSHAAPLAAAAVFLAAGPSPHAWPAVAQGCALLRSRGVHRPVTRDVPGGVRHEHRGPLSSSRCIANGRRSGADRFYNLVKGGFFDEVRFLPGPSGGQLAQFGMHGDPKVQDAWRDAVVRDDPVMHGNVRGNPVVREPAARNTRTTQAVHQTCRDNSA